MNLILTFGTFISIQIFTVRVWYVKNPPPCRTRHVFSTLFVKAWRLSSTSSWNLRKNCVRNPVDGLEIRRSPVEAGSWNPINIWRVFLHPNSGWPWDFWTISSSNRCPNHVAWRMSIVSTPPNHSRLDLHVFLSSWIRRFSGSGITENFPLWKVEISILWFCKNLCCHNVPKRDYHSTFSMKNSRMCVGVFFLHRRNTYGKSARGSASKKWVCLKRNLFELLVEPLWKRCSWSWIIWFICPFLGVKKFSETTTWLFVLCLKTSPKIAQTGNFPWLWTSQFWSYINFAISNARACPRKRRHPSKNSSISMAPPAAAGFCVIPKRFVKKNTLKQHHCWKQKRRKNQCCHVPLCWLALIGTLFDLW